MPLFIRYPPYIEVETTTRCNLRCLLCENRYWNEPKRDMTFDEYKMIVDQFPGLKWIGMTGIGEGFLNKDYVEMLRYIKSKGVFIELYDNFTLITPEIAKELIDIGIDNMIVSLDGATKETYEKIRVGANFDNVMENVKTYVELREKDKVKAKLTRFVFNMVVNKLNVHELADYVKMVHSLSCSLNITRPKVLFMRMLFYFKEVERYFTEIPPDLIKDADDTAKRLGLNIGWSLDVPEHKPPIEYCTSWLMPYITVTGHVFPCCSMNEQNQREKQKELSMGNIFETPFKEIWEGKRYRTLRKMIRNGKFPPFCVGCPIYE